MGYIKLMKNGWANHKNYTCPNSTKQANRKKIAQLMLQVDLKHFVLTFQLPDLKERLYVICEKLLLITKKSRKFVYNASI